MRLVFPVVVSLCLTSMACATAVDATGGGGTGDTGGTIEDTAGAHDGAVDGGDASKDSTATDGAIDARDSATGTDSSGVDTAGVDSTVSDSGVDSATIDSGVDTGKTDTGAIDSGVDVAPSDAGTGTLLISEVQTRGSAGGNDEFVEIYNPGSVAVSFDSTWTIAARSAVGTCAGNAQAIRYTGTGQVVGPHRHLLLTNSAGYDGAAVGDDTYSTGINDASSLVLYKGTTVIDAVCFYVDPATLANLAACPGAAYTCEGTPVTNLPHNNGTSGLSNTDVTIERKPGGSSGNGTDSGDNSSDFSPATIANPQNLTSPAVP